MTTPGNSASGTVPAQPLRGPNTMQPAKKVVLRRISSFMGPTQRFFIRESKVLGAVQIMNGIFHIALGGILMIPMGPYAPICVTVWYPLWGGIMYIISGSVLAAAKKDSRKSLVTAKIVMNSLSLFTSISGMILLVMDIFNIKAIHFLKMESLNLIKGYTSLINIYNCEAADKNSESIHYCYSMQSALLGLLSVMLIFTFFQELVTSGIVETEWKRMCSGPKANVVLLSADGKKEQETANEVVLVTAVTSQPKDEDIEIIPVQEEEMEVNFPEPPQD
ncbi:B-lymphocyte antigen CD20 isoform X1 [Tupaia chinensis]|uniref:B-lymphocyte antigen CD20 isoform X1 n=1 Tax=Tupaia chinensis TaxID=246437 RepID=UPI000703C3C3|nr:B-lymphocyte antigen CD20 isoform X1 [Tupaia chinensis]XP_014440391.1 B-lymphocyte antigen CD20 isoform X1 [Tupaia chinensis]